MSHEVRRLAQAEVDDLANAPDNTGEIEMIDKHTPGPWEVVREDEHEWSIWYKYYVDGEKRPRSSWLADSINSEADARLIAAAPDLLDALRLIATAQERGFGIDYAKGCALAAIARATGESE